MKPPVRGRLGAPSAEVDSDERSARRTMDPIESMAVDKVLGDSKLGWLIPWLDLVANL